MKLLNIFIIAAVSCCTLPDTIQAMHSHTIVEPTGRPRSDSTSSTGSWEHVDPKDALGRTSPTQAQLYAEKNIRAKTLEDLITKNDSIVSQPHRAQDDLALLKKQIDFNLASEKISPVQSAQSLQVDLSAKNSITFPNAKSAQNTIDIILSDEAYTNQQAQLEALKDQRDRLTKNFKSENINKAELEQAKKLYQDAITKVQDQIIKRPDPSATVQEHRSEIENVLSNKKLTQQEQLTELKSKQENLDPKTLTDFRDQGATHLYTNAINELETKINSAPSALLTLVQLHTDLIKTTLNKAKTPQEQLEELQSTLKSLNNDARLKAINSEAFREVTQLYTNKIQEINDAMLAANKQITSIKSNENISMQHQIEALKTAKNNDELYKNIEETPYDSAISILSKQLSKQGEISIQDAMQEVYRNPSSESFKALFTTLRTSISNLFTSRPKNESDMTLKELDIIEEKFNAAPDVVKKNSNFIRALQNKIFEIYNKAQQSFFKTGDYYINNISKDTTLTELDKNVIQNGQKITSTDNDKIIFVLDTKDQVIINKNKNSGTYDVLTSSAQHRENNPNILSETINKNDGEFIGVSLD